MSTYVVAIAGASGSGKSTVTEAAQKALLSDGIDSALLPLDNYYLPQDHLSMDERRKTNYDHPDQIEIGLFIEHLDDLINGVSINMPQYDFVNHTRSPDTRLVKPCKVTFVEGILALHYEPIVERSDITVYIETDSILWPLRRYRRDVKERGREPDDAYRQITGSVREGFRDFVKPSQRKATILLHWNDDSDTDQALDVLLNYLLSKLS